MVNFKINGKQLKATEGTTILTAARRAKIDIKTLCEYEKLNCIGACRICMVEIKGFKRLFAACNTPVEEGMEIFTNTPKTRLAVHMNLELLLSEHNTDCTKCLRSGNCKLQTLAEESNSYNNVLVSIIKQRSGSMVFRFVAMRASVSSVCDAFKFATI